MKKKIFDESKSYYVAGDVPYVPCLRDTCLLCKKDVFVEVGNTAQIEEENMEVICLSCFFEASVTAKDIELGISDVTRENLHSLGFSDDKIQRLWSEIKEKHKSSVGNINMGG